MQLRLTTYQELDSLISAWATTGELTLLAIISRPGLGKTEAATRTAGKLGIDRVLRLDTHVTPLQLYIELYRAKDKPVILDDLSDQILNHPVCLSILKSVCDSRRERRVQYNSTTPLLTANNCPPEFTTTSPVLLLSNVFNADSPAQEALLSRAIRVTFEPPVHAVLDYINTWQTDHEVFQWFEANAYLFPTFSARDFAVASQLNRAGLPWVALTMKSLGITPPPPRPTPLSGQETLPF